MVEEKSIHPQFLLMELRSANTNSYYGYIIIIYLQALESGEGSSAVIPKVGKAPGRVYNYSDMTSADP